MPVLLLLSLLLTLVPLSPPSHEAYAASPVPAAQVLPDTTAQTPKPPVEWRLGFDISALYSPPRGFGVGGKLRARHLGWTGSQWLLGTVLAQRYQRIRVDMYTQDPMRSRVYGGAHLYARTTTERPFFGVGPRTPDTVAVRLDHATVEAEGRLGGYVFDHSGLLVQPYVRFRYDRLSELTTDSRGLDGLDLASQASVVDVLAENRYGVVTGIGVLTDLRDRARYASRGWLAQASASHFTALDGSGLGFTRLSGTVYGLFPVAELAPRLKHHVAQLSVHVSTTRGGGDVLPFYYLPTLDQRTFPGFSPFRLTGRDLVVAGLAYRMPVPSLLDLLTNAFATDLIVGVQAGNAYNRLEDDFDLRLDFGTTPPDVGERAPLRPSFALGGVLLDAQRTRPLLTAVLGVTPEGFVLAEVALVYDLRGFRSPLR